MCRHHMDRLPVTEDDHVVGFVTQRDAAVLGGLPPARGTTAEAWWNRSHSG